VATAVPQTPLWEFAVLDLGGGGTYDTEGRGSKAKADRLWLE